MGTGAISVAVIRRLPRYYRYLGELLKNGVIRISSKELSERMGVTASQIRQDLNNFGGFGQQGYGYNVEYLYNEIGKILGLDQKNEIIIIGAGHLGQAIANYVDFARRGFIIKALFDVDPKLIGSHVGGIPIYDMAQLAQRQQEYGGLKEAPEPKGLHRFRRQKSDKDFLRPESEYQFQMAHFQSRQKR